MEEGGPQHRVRLVLAGQGQIKHFRMAIQALSKIGSDLGIQVCHDNLILQTMSSAQSAFLSLQFLPQFFEAFEIHPDLPVLQAGVLIKHILSSLRTQKIQQYEISVTEDCANLVATVRAENGIRKVYRFGCMQYNIQLFPEREPYPTDIVADAKELCRLLSTFQTSLDEVTLIANPESAESLASGFRACQIQSYTEAGGRRKAEEALHTVVAVDTRTFIRYLHRRAEPADVTFNVKDFRAMATLCEHMQKHISISMDEPGKPLVVEAHCEPGEHAIVRAQLMLGTLAESMLDAAVAVPRYASPQPAPHRLRPTATASQQPSAHAGSALRQPSFDAAPPSPHQHHHSPPQAQPQHHHAHAYQADAHMHQHARSQGFVQPGLYGPEAGYAPQQQQQQQGGAQERGSGPQYRAASTGPTHGLQPQQTSGATGSPDTQDLPIHVLPAPTGWRATVAGGALPPPAHTLPDPRYPPPPATHTAVHGAHHNAVTGAPVADSRQLQPVLLPAPHTAAAAHSYEQLPGMAAATGAGMTTAVAHTAVARGPVQVQPAPHPAPFPRPQVPGVERQGGGMLGGMAQRMRDSMHMTAAPQYQQLAQQAASGSTAGWLPPQPVAAGTPSYMQPAAPAPAPARALPQHSHMQQVALPYPAAAGQPQAQPAVSPGYDWQLQHEHQLPAVEIEYAQPATSYHQPQPPYVPPSMPVVPTPTMSYGDLRSASEYGHASTLHPSAQLSGHAHLQQGAPEEAMGLRGMVPDQDVGQRGVRGDEDMGAGGVQVDVPDDYVAAGTPEEELVDDWGQGAETQGAVVDDDVDM